VTIESQACIVCEQTRTSRPDRFHHHLAGADCLCAGLQHVAFWTQHLDVPADRKCHCHGLDAGLLHHPFSDHVSFCRCHGRPLQPQADDDDQRFHCFLATAGILTLMALGRLEFWHLYIAAALNGIGNTFQWPAYSAAIGTMIPKDQLGRVNGMMSLMEAGPGVLAPLMAGALMPVIGLTGLLTLDVVTFFFAIGRSGDRAYSPTAPDGRRQKRRRAAC
jgi:hypothetical protein